MFALRLAAIFSAFFCRGFSDGCFHALCFMVCWARITFHVWASTQTCEDRHTRTHPCAWGTFSRSVFSLMRWHGVSVPTFLAWRQFPFNPLSASESTWGIKPDLGFGFHAVTTAAARQSIS